MRRSLPIAAVLARAFAQDFDAASPWLRPSGVHAQQVAGEDGRFVAACSRPDLQVDILFVARIFRQQQTPQFGLGGLDFAL